MKYDATAAICESFPCEYDDDDEDKEEDEDESEGELAVKEVDREDVVVSLLYDVDELLVYVSD